MRIVLQRVSRASVRLTEDHPERGPIAEIGTGLLLLVGVERGDGRREAVAAAEKVRSLRIFADREGKMNLDVGAVGGQVLVVSQFTLASSIERGRRPSFSKAAPPEEAAPLIEAFVARLREGGLEVEEGEFGATMAVELVNNGPVTFVLEVGS